MSSEFAIEVKDLGKCYQIYDKPSDRLKQMLVRGRKHYYKEFWALKDVSFKIKKGETVGIIGRNGSGKSTLLQMICGTLNPTAGEVKLHGRVAALLELGAGFNPEFSGVENVYMAASLYGLTKTDVDSRLESISNFADIGEHIYQPVKTYSSGMYVRLAFSLIAHVNAEILIIDEALAVGDAVFTQKCMRFLREFMKSGTLLFVSHDTQSISNLCNRALWLDKGQCQIYDETEKVISQYTLFCAKKIYGDEVDVRPIILNEELTKNKNKNKKERKREKNGTVDFYENIENSEGWSTGAGEITKVKLLSEDGKAVGIYAGGEHLILEVEAKVNKKLNSPIIGFLVKDRLGQSLFGEHTYTYLDNQIISNIGDRLIASFKFELPYLPNGDYSITVSLADGDPLNHIQHHWLHDAAILTVESSRLRYGLVGIHFDNVTLKKIHINQR